MNAKELGEQAASPCEWRTERGAISYLGLTKRELFAAMAMQGMLGNGNPRADLMYAPKAVALADELLAELAKESQP